MADFSSELVEIFSSLQEGTEDNLYITEIKGTETKMRFSDPLLRHIMQEGSYYIDFDLDDLDMDIDSERDFDQHDACNSRGDSCVEEGQNYSGFQPINFSVRAACSRSPTDLHQVPIIHQPKAQRPLPVPMPMSGLSSLRLDSSLTVNKCADELTGAISC